MTCIKGDWVNLIKKSKIARMGTSYKVSPPVRVVIDCVEFRCESSRDYKQQGNLYSTYKSHTTVKALTGCAPNGSLMFVSHAFEGSISDRAITEQSGFLDYIEANDTVLADNGFTIHDLLDERDANLIIPPFKGKAK